MSSIKHNKVHLGTLKQIPDCFYFEMTYKKLSRCVSLFKINPILYYTIKNIVESSCSPLIKLRNKLDFALYLIYLTRGLLFLLLHKKPAGSTLLWNCDYLFRFIKEQPKVYNRLFITSFLMLITFTLVSKRVLYATATNTYIWKFYYSIFVTNLDIYQSSTKSKYEISLLKRSKEKRYLARLNPRGNYLLRFLVKKYCQLKSVISILYNFEFIDRNKLDKNHFMLNFQISIDLRIRLIFAIKLVEHFSVVLQYILGKC